MRGLLHVRAGSGEPWNEAHVTLPQIRVMSVLIGRPEGTSNRDLAALLGVGPSAVTPLVDRLVEHGYVRRQEDHADRRITRLYLTPEGATTLQQLAAGRREVLAAVLQYLQPDELDIVSQAFELVHQAIERSHGAASPHLGNPCSHESPAPHAPVSADEATASPAPG